MNLSAAERELLFYLAAFLFAFASGAACASTAVKKGRNAAAWFLLGVMVPLVGLIAVAVVSNLNMLAPMFIPGQRVMVHTDGRWQAGTVISSDPDKPTAQVAIDDGQIRQVERRRMMAAG